MGDIDGPRVVLGADVSAVDSELNKVSGKFDKLASQAKSSLSGIGKDFNLSNVSQQIDQVSTKLMGMGTTLSVAALPFEAFGALAVRSFSEFETGIAKIHTLLPEATKAEIDKIGENLKDFAVQYGANISVANQAYYDALSAGVTQSAAMPFLETAQKAGVAGMSDVSVAVDGLTSILNAYQMETSEAGKVSDVMFKTVELGKIEFGEMAANIGKVTPLAAQFGVKIEDVGAAVAAMTSQNGNAEMTMTELKGLLSQLGQSGTELSDTFKEISGKSFADFIKGGGNLVEAIRLIRDYSASSKTPLMDLTKNMEAAQALAMLGGDSFGSYAGMLDKVTKSLGSTDTAYSKVSETLDFNMKQLQAQMQIMMVDTGEALAPAIKDFTKWLSENSDEIKDFAVNIAETAVPAIEALFDILKDLMSAFNNLPKGTRDFLSGILGIGIGGAALGGPVMLGAGIALSPISSIVSLLAKLSVPTAVAGELGAIEAAAAGAAGVGGVGGLSTAIAALGGGPVVLALAGVSLGIAAWETDFMGVRTNVLGAAESVFNGFGNAVESGISFAQNGGKAVGDAFHGAFTEGRDYKSSLIANLQAAFSEATSTAGLEGRAAAAAYIEGWNADIASGRLVAPNIPDSLTATRTMAGTPIQLSGNSIVPAGGTIINGTVYSADSQTTSKDLDKFDAAFSKLPGAVSQTAETAAAAGASAGVKTGIAEELKKHGISDSLANDPDTQAAYAKNWGWTTFEDGSTGFSNLPGSMQKTTTPTATAATSSSAAAKTPLVDPTTLTRPATADELNAWNTRFASTSSQTVASTNRNTDAVTKSTTAAKESIAATKTSSSNNIALTRNLRDELLDALGFTNHGWMSETEMQNAVANGIRDGFPGVSSDLIAQVKSAGFSDASATVTSGSKSQTISSAVSQTSDQAFSSIKSNFANLKKQFDSGAISQDQYLDGLRSASAETDTLSRSTNILKGEQKSAILEFEWNIKESLRRIAAGTYGNQPISSIGSSITGLTKSNSVSGTIAAASEMGPVFARTTESASTMGPVFSKVTDTVNSMGPVFSRTTESANKLGPVFERVSKTAEALSAYGAVFARDASGRNAYSDGITSLACSGQVYVGGQTGGQISCVFGSGSSLALPEESGIMSEARKGYEAAKNKQQESWGQNDKSYTQGMNEITAANGVVNGHTFTLADLGDDEMIICKLGTMGSKSQLSLSGWAAATSNSPEREAMLRGETGSSSPAYTKATDDTDTSVATSLSRLDQSISRLQTTDAVTTKIGTFASTNKYAGDMSGAAVAPITKFSSSIIDAADYTEAAASRMSSIISQARAALASVGSGGGGGGGGSSWGGGGSGSGWYDPNESYTWTDDGGRISTNITVSGNNFNNSSESVGSVVQDIIAYM